MTIKEIAKKANVSITAVSFYLNGKTSTLSEKTILRIKKIVEENNYKPNISARNLRLKTTNNIGLIVNNVGQSYTAKLFKSITEGLKNNNYIISLFETELNYKKEDAIVRSLFDMRAHTIIIQASTQMVQNIEKIKNEYPKSYTKIIILDAIVKNKDISSVYHNSHDAIQKIINRAKKRGIKKIVFLSEDITLLPIRKVRRDTIKKLAEQKNMIFDEYQVENRNFNINILNKSGVFEIKDVKDSLIWTNNADNALNFYIKLYNKNKNISTNIHIASFNKCDFKPIIEIDLCSIDTKTKCIGQEVCELIVSNTTAIKEVIAIEEKYDHE